MSLSPEQEYDETLVCCKNVGTDGFVPCGKPAYIFYSHNDDLCCYCPEHDYPCGELIIKVSK